MPPAKKSGREIIAHHGRPAMTDEPARTRSPISVAVSSPSAVLVDVTISGATAFQTANLLENSAAGTNSISISAEL